MRWPIANGTQYALTGGLYSRSPHNIAQVKRRFLGRQPVKHPIAKSPVRSSIASRSAGSNYRGLARRPAVPIICCQFLVPRTITDNTLGRGFAPDTEPAGE